MADRVGLIKGVPGVLEDPAYFLPREFSDITVQDISALNEKRFWIGFRDSGFNENGPILQALKDRGYEVREVLQIEASAQRAFLVEVEKH